MRKRKGRLMLVLLIAIIGLSACKNQEAKEETSLRVETGQESESNRVKMKIDDFVNLDVVPEVPEELKSLKMKKVNAHRPELDVDILKEIFLHNQVKKKEVDKGYKSREIGDYTIDSYYGKQNEILSCGWSNIHFSGVTMDYYYNTLHTDPQFDTYNLDKFSLTENLPFAKREEVFQTVKSIFEKVDIPISDEYEAYALDHDTLKKEDNPIDVDGNVLKEARKSEWTKEDDAYFFFLHQEVEGVPIRQIQYGDGYHGIGVDQTELSAIYGAQGWISFVSYWGYSLEETSEDISIISVDDALKSLQKKCDMLVTNDKWDLDELDLELMPVFIKDNDYEIRPVWSFKGEAVAEDGLQYDLEILFDGISGKEIII
ncbi:MAG: hypothetical protein Q4B70_06065 [Lachnospiraceae bacterium]|nr:hypothetical protein [Lachnospiraceae bacterium]